MFHLKARYVSRSMAGLHTWSTRHTGFKRESLTLLTPQKLRSQLCGPLYLSTEQPQNEDPRNILMISNHEAGIEIGATGKGGCGNTCALYLYLFQCRFPRRAALEFWEEGMVHELPARRTKKVLWGAERAQ